MRAVFLALGFSAGLAATPFADGARDQIQGVMESMAPMAAAMPICSPVTVSIYFEHGSSGLSTAAQSTLSVMSERVRGCAIASVAIENQPATVASEEGRRLAGLRGAGVLRSLSARGLAPAAIVITESDSQEPAGAVTPDNVRILITPVTGALAAPAGNRPVRGDKEI